MNAKTVELHLLQSFPPSCVNRDGNNSPKDCTFGGVRRARISSQCLKRAIRQATVFSETTERPISARSRLWVDELARDGKITDADGRSALITLMGGLLDQIDEEERLEEADPDEASGSELPHEGDEETMSPAVLRSKVLLHLPRNAAAVIMPILETNRVLLLQYSAASEEAKSSTGKTGSKKAKNPFQKPFDKVTKELIAAIIAMPQAPDIALFGRMLAENPKLNVDAASQVAHAISTHRLSQETDYWTAADDLKNTKEGDDAGAGMLGTAEFNASVFYRYACVSLDILKDNLKDDELVRKTVEAFLLASQDAIPTGKLNGHAHFTRPFLALAAVRTKGMPLNLCNAFCKPVRASVDKGLDEASAQALLDQLDRERTFASADEATYILAHSLPTELPMPKAASYPQLVAEVMAAL